MSHFVFVVLLCASCENDIYVRKKKKCWQQKINSWNWKKCFSQPLDKDDSFQKSHQNFFSRISSSLWDSVFFLSICLKLKRKREREGEIKVHNFPSVLSSKAFQNRSSVFHSCVVSAQHSHVQTPWLTYTRTLLSKHSWTYIHTQTHMHIQYKHVSTHTHIYI